MFSACAGQLHSQTILHFEPPHASVPGDNFSVGIYGIAESGMLFTAPRFPDFVNGGGLTFRDPPPGLLNLSGLNTVPYNGSTYAVPFTGAQPVLQHAGGLPFHLLSLDLAPYSASFSD